MPDRNQRIGQCSTGTSRYQHRNTAGTGQDAQENRPMVFGMRYPTRWRLAAHAAIRRTAAHRDAARLIRRTQINHDEQYRA